MRKFDKLVTIYIWVTVFAIAMGFLETSVVIYLRKIYYPDGFQFPLQPISSDLALTEIIREATTIIMLAGIGFLAGKNFVTRFAWFIYSFAIWDIFYYVFLKLLLNWPESLLTWDILFLIPATWVGPVITPIILSALMILFALRIIKKELPIILREWLLLILGSLIVIFSFILDYMTYILSTYSLSEVFNPLFKDRVLFVSSQFIPQNFNWLIFTIGTLTIIFGITFYYIRTHETVKGKFAENN